MGGLITRTVAADSPLNTDFYAAVDRKKTGDEGDQDGDQRLGHNGCGNEAESLQPGAHHIGDEPGQGIARERAKRHGQA